MKKSAFLIALLWFAVTVSGISQTESELLAGLMAQDSGSIEALALYPEDIRADIFQACTHPELVIRLEQMQQKTSDSFRKLLENEPRATQEQIWDLTRYPDLIDQVAGGEKKSEGEIRAILAHYPEEIHTNALELGRRKYDLLHSIADLNWSSDIALHELLADYPTETHRGIESLLAYPEILGILAGNMRMTVLVGDLYRKNPEYVLQQMDSLHLELARQNAAELEAYKKGLEANPEAVNEMKSAAESFAAENGYDRNEYTTAQTVEVVHVYHPSFQPYPYWYGYPWWYDTPYWYPYPWWYHWGWYYGPGGSIVVFGMPSWYYCHWYYGSPWHHYHYPHLTNYYLDHYHAHPHRYGQRGSLSSLRSATGSWVDDNKSRLPRDWYKQDEGRVARIREYGKFESDLRLERSRRSTRTVDRTTYLDKNTRKYPSLDPTRSAPAPAKNWATPRNVQPQTDRKYKVETTRPPVYREVDRAKNYHQRTWDRSTPVRRTPTMQPNTRPPTRTNSNRRNPPSGGRIR